MGTRDNNLDALRLAAAVTVVIAHAWPLTGTEGNPRVAGILLSHLAVYVFFSVSGYLIATSWRFSPRPAAFLARRSARIFPALIVVVLFSVFALGPVMTQLPTGAYFSSTATWSYLSGLVLAPSYALPGVFVEHPTDAVNGSLWTLGPEFLCYLMVLGIGLSVVAAKARHALIVTPIAFGVMALLFAGTSFLGSDKPLRDASIAMTFFAVGAVFAYLPRLRIPGWVLALIVALWAVLGSESKDIGIALGWLIVPVVALSLGLRSTPGVRRAGRFGDFSYGMYLWAFPVQQVVVAAFPTLPLLASICLAIAGTAVFAIASWHLVEKRALRWARTYSQQQQSYRVMTVAPRGR